MVALTSLAQLRREDACTEIFQAKISSNILKKGFYGDFDRLGNAKQCLDGNDFFPSLNFAEVLGIQIHRLRQFLLR